MAASSAIQEAIYLRNLLQDLKHEQKGPTTLFQDNQGAIMIGNNAISNARTKYIDIKHHFVREKVANQQIKLEYIHTSNMIADCLTKPISKHALDKNLTRIFGNSQYKADQRESSLRRSVENQT
jgi:hypothetical protein